MGVLTVPEARQNLALLLDQAIREGEARIRREDGQVFVIKPESELVSPLDIQGLGLGITTTEIVQFVQEGRRFVSAETNERR